MSKGKWIVALAVVALASVVAANMASARIDVTWDTPKLPAGVTMTLDGDPSEWTDFAYTDGVWDWDRIIAQPWYNPAGANSPPSATGPDEGAEAGTPDDFSVEFWSAWDDQGVVIAASATDNIWDVHSVGADSPSYVNSDVVAIQTDSNGGFIERDQPGFNSYWWRVGSGATDGTADDMTRSIISLEPGNREQFHGAAANPHQHGRGIVDPVGVSPNALGGSWVFEARVNWEAWTFSNPEWVTPFEGREMGWQWLFTDADGATRDNIFLIAQEGESTHPNEAGWTTFVAAEGVAVETSSWGQVKQLFK